MTDADADTVLVPPLPTEVLASVSAQSDAFVSSANDNIEALGKLARLLPARYGWRFKTVEALKAEIIELSHAGGKPADINRLYWMDTLKTCEAYTVMSVWRLVELARAVVWAAARKDLVCAALVSRAALESAVQYVDVARTVSKTLEPIFETDLTRNIGTSKELEEYLLKAVFASKLPQHEQFYNPTNIITILGRIAKIRDMPDITSHYGLLCEVAHPNFLGRSIYLLDSQPGPRDGDEIRIIGLGEGPSSKTILRSTVWALSWASATQVTATELMQSTIARVMEVLPKTR
jgi:hypothetical protein